MNTLLQEYLIVPNWPAPNSIRAVSTTRLGGVSALPYDSLNIAEHVNDHPSCVSENRRILAISAGYVTEPAWLKQVHGNQVIAAEASRKLETADAAWTCKRGLPCVVMTADCLPILLCDRFGTVVAAAHAGWRGLACSVIEATVSSMGVAPEELLAWLGPAIGPLSFRIGDEVRSAILANDAGSIDCFQPSLIAGYWLADIYQLARRQLSKLGVQAVFGGGFCTFSELQRFFSYRREGQTGRMASLIWLV
jgi:YfiH family protein